MTNAYLYLESSAMCELSSTIQNKKAKLMEKLTYEIKYLQSITLKKTEVESTDVPSDVTELPSIETVLPVYNIIPCQITQWLKRYPPRF